MFHRSLFTLPFFFALAVVALSPSEAHARGRGLVVITWGEDIKHVEDIPPEIKPILQEKLSGNWAVGYKYRSFGVFWLDLWTWDGRLCLYQGDRYSPLEPRQAALLLNKSERELSKPFFYMFPPGLLIVLALAAIAIPIKFLGKSDEQELNERLAQIATDSRYKEALEIVADETGNAGASEAPEGDGSRAGDPESQAVHFQSAFEKGVEHLVEQGIERSEADENLRLLLAVLMADAKES